MPFNFYIHSDKKQCWTSLPRLWLWFQKMLCIDLHAAVGDEILLTRSSPCPSSSYCVRWQNPIPFDDKVISRFSTKSHRVQWQSPIALGYNVLLHSATKSYRRLHSATKSCRVWRQSPISRSATKSHPFWWQSPILRSTITWCPIAFGDSKSCRVRLQSPIVFDVGTVRRRVLLVHHNNLK